MVILGIGNQGWARHLVPDSALFAYPQFSKCLIHSKLPIPNNSICPSHPQLPIPNFLNARLIPTHLFKKSSWVGLTLGQSYSCIKRVIKAKTNFGPFCPILPICGQIWGKIENASIRRSQLGQDEPKLPKTQPAPSLLPDRPPNMALAHLLYDTMLF